MSLIKFKIFLLSICLMSPAYSQNLQDSLNIDSTKTSQVADSLETAKNASSAMNSTLINSVPESFSINAGKIIWTIIALIVAYIIIRYLSGLLDVLSERWSNIRLGIKRLIPIFRISSWNFVLYFIITDIIAPPIETLVAVTASAGIAIGFASQDILKNIFGGIMILFDRPFQVGDKIEVGSHYGEVVNIGLRTVRIVTTDDSLVSIPNSEIVNQSVSNSNSGETNCQVVAEFYLPPNIDRIKVKKIAYLAAATSRYVYLNKAISIIFKNEIHQGRSVIKMRLKAYVLDIRYEFLFSSEMTDYVLKELYREKLIQEEALTFVKD